MRLGLWPGGRIGSRTDIPAMIISRLDIWPLKFDSLELDELPTLEGGIAANLSTRFGPFSSRLGRVSVSELGLERVDNRQRLKRRGESSKISHWREKRKHRNRRSSKAIAPGTARCVR